MAVKLSGPQHTPPMHDAEVTLSITIPYIFVGHQRCLSLVPRAFEELTGSSQKGTALGRGLSCLIFHIYFPQTTKRG